MTILTLLILNTINREQLTDNGTHIKLNIHKQTF